MISIQCDVDRSCLSTFSYAMSCTCICQLDWLPFCFKVINSLMQADWVSNYKQTDWSWTPIFRTIRLQQRDHSFRYCLCFPSVARMSLRRNVPQEDDILCEFMRIHVLMFLIIVTMKVTSLQLVHTNNCDLLLIHWPHNFHIYFSSHLSRQFSLPCEISSDIARQKCEGLQHYEGLQGHSTWPRRGRQALEKREVSVTEEWWHNGASVERQDLCKW